MARATRWEALLDVAAGLFSRQGFAATSIREVAAGAGFSKAGLYYHIREKEDLLFHICSGSIDAILAEVRPAIAAVDTDIDAEIDAGAALSRLGAVVRVHVGFFHRHPDRLKVLVHEMGHLPPVQRRRIQTLERDYLDLIRDIIADGQTSGGLAPMEPTVAAFLLLSMLNGLHAWYDPGGRQGADEIAKNIEQLFLTGLGTGAPPAASINTFNPTARKPA